MAFGLLTREKEGGPDNVPFILALGAVSLGLGHCSGWPGRDKRDQGDDRDHL